MTEVPPVPRPESDPAIPPPAITLPYAPPRGSDPQPLELNTAEHAAHLHASSTTVPDFSQPGNVLDDRPHFLRILDGQDPDDGVCGQDGEPWPCQSYRKLIEQHPGTLPQGTPLAGLRYPGAVVGLEAAAVAAGMSVEDFQLRLAQQQARTP